jgi:hypothetical protein
MTLHGRDVLQTLDDAYRQAESQAQQNQNQLSALQGKHSDASRQLREAYAAIVRARRQDPSAGRNALDTTDKWLAQADAKRQADYQDLLSRLGAATKDAASEDAQHEQAVVRNRSAKEAWARARATMRAALAPQEGFAQHLARQADAVRRSQAVDEHLDEISNTTQTLEKQCMADPLFAYCYNRNVGTAQASGWWFVRALDRLVARSVDYYSNRSLLLGAREDLQKWVQHQALMRNELNEANAVVEKAIDVALENPEGVALSTELSSAGQSLEKAVLEKDKAHARVAMLSSDKALFDQEQDPVSLEMNKRLLHAVENASDASLARAVLETADKSDDREASKVAQLRNNIPQLTSQITQASAQAEQAQESAQRLRKLVSDFRSRGFADTYSRFDYGFDPAQLATQVMLGRITVSSALGQCSQSHRDVTPPPPPPPPPPSSYGGGGGFSSGGSIGGGGGFSTGGRF